MSPYTEDELLPLSALQHLVFCERQCALIHLERIWEENCLTVEGHQLHDRTHETESESRGNRRVARGLRLHSFHLGLAGMADVVEFHRLLSADSIKSSGVRLQNDNGLWQPFPVEYKHGRPKNDLCDKVQLCAQAFCLEEMLKVAVPRGALYYGAPHRREEIIFNSELRKETEKLAIRFHELHQSKKTPPANYEKKCNNCSLLSFCLPKIVGRKKSVGGYITRMTSDCEDE